MQTTARTVEISRPSELPKHTLTRSLTTRAIPIPSLRKNRSLSRDNPQKRQTRAVAYMAPVATAAPPEPKIGAMAALPVARIVTCTVAWTATAPARVVPVLAALCISICSASRS